MEHDNHFGLIRYLLALAVFIVHFNYFFHTSIWFPLSGYNAVGGFFALSGYLIYSSYERSGRSVGKFLERRARRILPSYWAVVLISAFLLVFLSSLSFRQYFFSWQWVRYVAANMAFLNFLEPSLPGVFTHSATSAVNGALWTIKVEWLLYLSVPVVAWLTALVHRRYARVKPIALFSVIIVLSMAYRYGFHLLYVHTGSEIINMLSRQVFGQLTYFYTGVIIFFLGKKFERYGLWATLISLALCFLFGHEELFYYALSPVPIAVAVLYFSTRRGCMRVFNRNNFSYDFYLWHMLMLQVVYQCFATVLPLWLCFIIALSLTVVMGMLSWHFLGKPALRPGNPWRNIFLRGRSCQ